MNINVHSLDDTSTLAAFHAGTARLKESIKAAAARGVDTTIKSEPGGIIPRPDNLDPYHGRVCLAPGLKKAGFGKSKVCGREVVGTLRTFRPERPSSKSLDSHAADINRIVAMQAYGGVNSGRIPAGRGQAVGNLVPGPDDPPGDSDLYVCAFHILSAHKDTLHPDDGGTIREDAKPEAPIIGLEHLDSSRQWRATSQDGTFVWVSDGLVTVMALKRDYIKYLAEHGSLPPKGQPLP